MVSKVPPLSVSFDENKKKGFLSFLSPREKSSVYAHASPRVQIDPRNDSLLQRTVEAIWFKYIADPSRIECDFSIPFSERLLFGELSGLNPTKVAAKKETSSRRSSAIDLRERITHAPESPNYLNKFLEISELMLQCKKERKKHFTVSAAGFDREFFKTALFHHYPEYIDSIASKQKRSDPGLLQVVMKREVSDLDELKQKIDRLRSLTDRVNQTTSSIFPPPFRYQDPADLLSHPHFLNRNKITSAESGPSNWMPKEERQVFKAASEEIETGRMFFRKQDLDGDDLSLNTPYSPFSLQEGAETDILSDCELTSESQNEYISYMAQELADLVMHKLGGRMPKTTQSNNWKRLWNSIENPRQLKLNQSKLRELVSLKCELAKASFALIPFLSDDQKEKCLNKTTQMKWIEDDQIERSIYPQGAKAPIAKVFVNGKELLSEAADWTRELSLDYFRALLSELFEAQQKYTPHKAEQLLAGLFDYTNLLIHPNPAQDILIMSMLKSSTFGFGGNVFWILKSFFPLKHRFEVHDTKDYQPTYEFFTDESRDGTIVRTAAFTLLKIKGPFDPKEELGIFVTKLISSFSNKTGKWSFRVEIPNFEPSLRCSLREQRDIHRKLLGK